MNITYVLSWIVALLWVLTAAGFVFVLLRAARNVPLKKGVPVLIGLVALAIILTVVNSGLVFIQPQERGVVISAVQPTGYRADTLQPGLHWIIPFAENVISYQISNQTYTMSIASEEGQRPGDDSVSARTSDGQEIYVDASVIFTVDPSRIIELHIKWQDRYSEDLVRPLARGVIRDAISQFSVEQVISSERFTIVEQISEALTEKLQENGVIMIDFILRNIAFSPEYASSVEQKQIAEQQSQQAIFVVEQKKQEAEQARQEAQGLADAVVIAAEGQAEARILEAEAEAKALEVQAQVIAKYPDLLTYVYITKLSPNVEVMFLPSNAPFIFPLPDMGPNIPPTDELPSETP